MKVDMIQEFSRFAIYYLPSESNLLSNFASSWFGWNPHLGMEVSYPVWKNLNFNIAELTSEPGKYGLHGTLKPPFPLAKQENFEELRVAILKLSRSIKKFKIPSITLRVIDGFIAIVPTIRNERIDYLAEKCVKELDDFRGPESLENIKKRRSVGLSERQENHLRRWGYPYVLDDFNFHLTMTEKLRPEVSERVFLVLASKLESVLMAPLLVDKIFLCGESVENGKFKVIEKFSLID